MTRILLTNTPWHDKKHNKWHGIRAGCRWPFIMNTPLPPADTLGYYNTYPFFMGYATNYLAWQAKVGEIFFYDALARAHTYDKFYDGVKTMDPDIVIMETSTPSIENDLEIAGKLKLDGREIALVGPHATVYASKLIKLPQIDYVLQGEYEIGAYEMCLMRKKKVYPCRQIINIDTIRYPYRDESVLLYADGFGQDKYMEYPQLQVWTSRGCPHECNFCLWRSTMTRGYYRRRSAKAVCREISDCMRSWGFRSVLLDDDTFNISDKHTVEVADGLGHLRIQWHAMVRPDTCSWESFQAMRDNGCVGLKIGVESFSQNGLDYVKKGYNATRLTETIDFLIDIGFKVFLSLMDQIPGENDEDRAETYKWLKYFVAKGASYQHPRLTALPGTPLYDTSEKKEKWADYGKFH